MKLDCAKCMAIYSKGKVIKCRCTDEQSMTDFTADPCEMLLGCEIFSKYYFYSKDLKKKTLIFQSIVLFLLFVTMHLESENALVIGE